MVGEESGDERVPLSRMRLGWSVKTRTMQVRFLLGSELVGSKISWKSPKYKKKIIYFSSFSGSTSTRPPYLLMSIEIPSNICYERVFSFDFRVQIGSGDVI